MLYWESLNTKLENLLFTFLGFYFVVELIRLFSMLPKSDINPLKLLLFMGASIVTSYPDSKIIYIFRISVWNYVDSCSFWKKLISWKNNHEVPLKAFFRKLCLYPSPGSFFEEIFFFWKLLDYTYTLKKIGFVRNLQKRFRRFEKDCKWVKTSKKQVFNSTEPFSEKPFFFVTKLKKVPN